MLAFVGWNLLHFVGQRNADWTGYQTLFDGGGAWLADLGRDPGFLALVNLFRSLGSYESFRAVVGVYFFCFVAWLLYRWRPYLTNKTYLWAFAGLLPLLIPKLTVQIREGLAQTLILAAFTLLYERERRSAGINAIWPTVVLLMAAATIHGGTVIFLVALLIPCGVYRLTKVFGTRHAVRDAWVLTGVAITATLYSVDLDEWLGSVASGFLGGFSDAEADADGFKMVYWAAKCATVIYLIQKVRLAVFNRVVFGLFMRYAAYALVPVLQLIVLYTIFAGYPSVIASVAIRAYQAAFYVVFALASLTTRATKVNGLIAALLLIDEYRIMTAAGGN